MRYFYRAVKEKMHFQKIGIGFVFYGKGLFFKPIYERHPANADGRVFYCRQNMCNRKAG